MSADPTAQGEDILAWLETAVVEAASNADRWHDRECDVHLIGLADVADMLMAAEVPGAVCDCAGPASVLRRCAADRKLLELHRRKMHSCPAKDATGYLDEWTQFDYGDTCPVVRLLAQGYGWEAQR
ncbi:hypothetical protein [Streptomyces sp. 8L]|uniref:hypothetical protein n=1 Tax=Streptomyces sp. 8L TaxID=2877242 RepID=UPI001CD7908E|nr:hypothetical protein [Streptomyces sp. 8L]MCA1223440.1 hypothetical protein [Streptomyces sp. 8L]